MIETYFRQKNDQWTPYLRLPASFFAWILTLILNAIPALTSFAFASPASCTLSPLLIPSENFSISTSPTHPDLMISSAGNIGIGTDSPAAQLHLRGVDSSGTNLTHALRVINSSGDSLLRVSTTTSNTSTGDLSIGWSSSTRPLTFGAQTVSMSQLTVNGPLQLDGNLTLQQASLQVPIQVGAGASPNEDVVSTNVPPLAVAASLSQSANQPAPSAVKIISASLDPLLKVQLNGNVGINQDQPTETLDIIGGLSFSGKYIQFTPQSIAPTCNSSRVGLLALSATYTLCSCSGSAWLNAATGATCTWSAP